MKNLKSLLVVLALVASFLGCSSQTAVVATSQTGIGIVASYNPATQFPEGKLGYLRNEVVIVPTNKVPDDAYDENATPAKQEGSGGAKDTADVIMEFNFTNFFSFWRSNGIYQRIAVGENAVTNAEFVFMKDDSGKIDKDAIEALKAIRSLPKVSDSLSIPSATTDTERK